MHNEYLKRMTEDIRWIKWLVIIYVIYSIIQPL